MANKMKAVALGYNSLKPELPAIDCPLCGNPMEYDGFVRVYFCYASDNGKCPVMESTKAQYDESLQGKTIAWNGGAEFYAVRGPYGRTNVCVAESDKIGDGWVFEIKINVLFYLLTQIKGDKNE